MADVPHIGQGAIQVPTTDTGTPGTLALISIARRGMRIVGTQTDPEVLQAALEALQDSINDVNIREVFDFTTTRDTDVPIVTGKREYDIPDSAFSLKELLLVDTSKDPEDIIPIGYIDWDQLQRIFRQDGTAFPSYWSARDVFINRKIQLAPAPSAEVADRYVIRIWYRTALDRPSVNDPKISINGPEVLSTVLQRYVEYRLLGIFGDPRDPRRAEAYAEYTDLRNQLKGMENRSRPGGTQMRLKIPPQGATGYWGRHRGPFGWR